MELSTPRRWRFRGVVGAATICLAVGCRNSPGPSGRAGASAANAAPATTTSNTRGSVQTGFQMSSVTLYQPNEVLQARVPDTRALAAYIQSVTTVCQEHFAEARTPELLDVVVAIKPGRRARAWLVSATRTESEAALDALRRQIEAIRPTDVREGPVAFAIIGSIAGASRPPFDAAGYEPPMPREWRDAPTTGSEDVVPDDILRVIWP